MSGPAVAPSSRARSRATMPGVTSATGRPPAPARPELWRPLPGLTSLPPPFRRATRQKKDRPRGRFRYWLGEAQACQVQAPRHCPRLCCRSHRASTGARSRRAHSDTATHACQPHITYLNLPHHHPSDGLHHHPSTGSGQAPPLSLKGEGTGLERSPSRERGFGAKVSPSTERGGALPA